jgi:hypothetical protein
LIDLNSDLDDLNLAISELEASGGSGSGAWLGSTLARDYLLIQILNIEDIVAEIVLQVDELNELINFLS